MSPTRRLFLVSWVVGLAALWGCATQLPEPLSDDFVALAMVAAVLPWAAGPGLMPLLARMPAHLINLPHSEYWFATDRRAQSLLRLRPYVDVMGTLLAVFLGAVVLLYTGERVDPLLASYSAMLFLLAVGCFLSGIGLWMRALLKAFARPTPVRGRSTSARR